MHDSEKRKRAEKELEPTAAASAADATDAVANVPTSSNAAPWIPLQVSNVMIIQ